METKFRVIATVPTAYQFNSCKFFGSPVKTGDGGYQVEQIFETEEEAKDYLYERIDIYSEENGSEKEIEKMCEQVENGYLEYDACMAKIERVTTGEMDDDDRW